MMMITILPEKTVFDSPAQTIVNPVNCVGVMGKGLALAVKSRYPEVFDKYVIACESGKMRIGNLQLVKTADRWILNFPTKKHWRGASKLEFVEAGLKKFVKTYRRRHIASAAFPPLGCGHGGLKWDEVEPLMRRYLEGLDKIEIFFCLSEGNASKSETRSPRHGEKASADFAQRKLWE
jgi:O-acetyl-ADP-ribose deacetylase (regulator of RNase III)